MGFFSDSCTVFAGSLPKGARGNGDGDGDGDGGDGGDGDDGDA